MVKPEEIKPRFSHRQPDDAGLRRFGFQTQLGQQDSQLRERSLGLFPGGAHHHHVIGEPDQHPMPANVPCPIDPVQVDVSQQRRNDAPNAMGNFIFDVTLRYRWLAKPRNSQQRVTDNM